MTDEMIAEEVSFGEGSEKYYNGSSAQFNKNIRDCLLKNGVNLEELKIILKKNEEYRGLMLDDPERYVKEGVQKQAIDNMGPFYLAVIPSILDLIDEGYTLFELKR